MDHLDHEEPCDCMGQLASKMKMLRSKASCETLFRLCLIAVVKNHDYFLQLPYELEETEELVSPSASWIQRAESSSAVTSCFVRSPINKVSKPANFNKSSRLSLKSLPNTIVQQLMNIIFEQARWKKPKLMSSEKEDAFVLLLLSNPNVTEYKYGMFFDYGDHSETDKTFNHLLKTCPKMNYYIGRFDGDKYDNLEFPALMLSKWKNLKHLEMVRFYMTDESMKVVQETLPLLEKLAFSLTSYEGPDTVMTMTLVGVEHMAKMKKLKILHIDESCFNLSMEERLIVVGHCAGKLQNLKEFFIDTVSDYLLEEFVKFYGDHYPCKELTLTVVSLTANFLGNWPSCLKVESLNFEELTPESVEKLCGSNLLPVKEFISIDKMGSSQIYALLEKLGSEITSLTIYRVPKAENLDLYKVVGLCPHLEDLLISNSKEINLMEAETEPSPCIFKKFKSFSVDRPFANIASETEFLKMFKMFLIGSENKYQTLSMDGHILKTALEAYLVNPTCFANVKKIKVQLWSSHFGRLTEEVLIHVVHAFMLCTHLAMRSIHLEHIKFSGSVLDHVQEQLNVVKTLVESTGVKFEGPH